MCATAVESELSDWYLTGQLVADGAVRRVAISSVPFRIGRRPEHPLCLNDRSVSTDHAEIFEDNGKLAIRDLGSTNGTFVNGLRIKDISELRERDLVQLSKCVLRLCRDQPGSSVPTHLEDTHGRALAMIQFDRLMSQDAFEPFLQPIVDVRDGTVFGFEALGRSRLVGLMNPSDMFGAASQLDMEAELSRAFRRQGVTAARRLSLETSLFLNTHPVELVTDGLVESLHEIRQLDEDRRIILEIHEATVPNLTLLRQLRDKLEELQMQLAYDDFGTGHDRLAELIEVRPHILKFDMALIRGIHLATSRRHQFLQSLVQMVTDLGVVPLAEGVEHEGEHATCRQLGFQLAQGFLYGRPAVASQYCQARCQDLP